MNPANPWIDLIWKIVTAAATTGVAIYVARISKRQWLTNQEKLRLDLYGKRFEIYLRVLEFSQALTAWEGKGPQLALQDPFIKAYRESKFLFPESSGVYAFLTEFFNHSFVITNFGNIREAMKGMPAEFSLEIKKRTDSVNWILASMDPLEKKMAKFLSFHQV